jgi:hypothetical protein
MVKAKPVRQLNEKPGIVGPVFYVHCLCQN